MSELDTDEKMRALAVLEAQKAENLRMIESYVGDKNVTIYGVHPNGVEYAGVFAAALRVTDRDVILDTYQGDVRFDNESRVKDRRVIVVKENASSNGSKEIAKKAGDAALNGHMDPDDFRLLIVYPFRMLGIPDLYPEFEDLYRSRRNAGLDPESEQ